MLGKHEKFAEYGRCVAGGLYCTNHANIHEYYDYGVWLREVRLPVEREDFKVMKIVADPTVEAGEKWRANMLVMGDRYPLFDVVTIKRFNLKVTEKYVTGAIKHGDMEVINYLYNHYMNVWQEQDSEDLMRHAIGTGDIEKVKYVHAKHRYDKGFQLTSPMMTCALIRGSCDVIEYLLQEGTPLMFESISTRWEVEQGIVDRLIKHYGRVTIYNSDQEYYDAMKENTEQEVRDKHFVTGLRWLSVASFIGGAIGLFMLRPRR